MSSEQILMKLCRLRRHRDAVQAELNALQDEISRLELDRDRERYNCSCVRLNSDIGIGDIHEQERRGRTGCTLGWVARTLSALKDCSVCHGSGVAEETK